jgi:hypothetical protein
MFILSSAKLKIRAKQFLLGSEGVGARERGWGKGQGRGKGGGMIHSLYAHMNKGN